jgi:predicted acylesterase/phospholipase RssA
VTLQEQGLELAKTGFDFGATSELDVQQSRSRLEGTRSPLSRLPAVDTIISGLLSSTDDTIVNDARGGLMTKRQTWQGAALLLLVAILSACATTKHPPPPPDGGPVAQPWGSVPLGSADAAADTSLSESLVSSLRKKFEQARAADATGKIPYRALALSGGGSRGAYGAGVLSGWTARGDRPQFDVVTGISTGALMATHIFLGSDFDENLAIFKRLTNDDVYKKRGILDVIRSAAAYDTAPLRETLKSLLSEEILDLVAAEHQAGRRLFIGSTNLDANLFTIWNMGAIAESDRPDRLQRYIDAVMASAAFPIAFPPVYIEVEVEGGTYSEMHVDGGVRETAFYFDFVKELYAAAEAAGLSVGDFKQELYLLINGQLAHSGSLTYEPVDRKLKEVVGATINSLMTNITRGSVFRLWVRTMIDGADFHLSYIPEDFEFRTHTLMFDPEEEVALFELGYRQSLDGTAWATQLAPESTELLLERILDPASRFDIQDRVRLTFKRGAD